MLTPWLMPQCKDTPHLLLCQASSLGVQRWGKRSAHPERQHSPGSAQEALSWEQHPLFLSPAPSPRSSVHTAEGLLWDLLCLRPQSSLPRHSVAESMAASDLESLEGKVWCGVPQG